MTCPTCKHGFQLPWRKYLNSPLGHHACPHCHQRVKLVLTASSFLVVGLVSLIAAGTPAVVVFFWTHNFWYTIAAYVLFILAVVMPFDRWLDNNVRPVKPAPARPLP
jgi:uncharacterized protein (DUF983 family)